MTREVILFCGPPGAGKTTVARALAAERELVLYDRDDDRWVSERHFASALRAVGDDRDARAVVIRSAPSSERRAEVRAQVGATATFLVFADPQVCVERIRLRGRGDEAQAVKGVAWWFDRFDHADAVRVWDGVYDPDVPDIGLTSRAW